VTTMATVAHVAKHILLRLGPMTTLKLQKLVYYCQAWHLVWEERPLFPEEIEAWANGPVVPQLYQMHRGRYDVEADNIPVAEPNLQPEELSTIEGVLSFYGDKTAQWLSDLSHNEQPWLRARARRGARPGDYCTETIPLVEMMEYYSALVGSR
jgi:uncharacterized phage-associated protein